MTTTRTPAQVRQDVATRLAGLSNAWTEALVPPDQLGHSGVPESLPATQCAPGVYAFTVDCPELRANGERHQTIFYGRTPATVRFLSALKPPGTGLLASLDAGLDAEHAAIKRLDSQWSTSLIIYFENSRRSTVAGGQYTLHEMDFSIDHWIALT